MSKDYYKILGIDKNASDKDIKKAFSKLAHQYHPDKKGGNEAKFKEINEAYQVLKNKEKRQKYDQFGSADANPFGSNSGFSGSNPFSGTSGFGGFQQGNINIDDLGDIFGDIFGGGFRGRGTSKTQKGHDIQISMNISFEEAIFGTEKTIELKKNIICSHCNGKGGTGFKTCSKCQGTGKIRIQQNTFFGNFQSSMPCPDCDGQGQVIDRVCAYCGGKGFLMGKDKIEVKIPAGIDDGQTLRLSSKGEAGFRGGPAGDLFIKINVSPSPKFERDGQDIKSAIRLKYSQLLKGDKILVDTVDGLVKLKIPPFTPSNKVFILKNKGVPNLHGHGRGNHLVTVKLFVPNSLTREQKKIVEELEKNGL